MRRVDWGVFNHLLPMNEEKSIWAGASSQAINAGAYLSCFIASMAFIAFAIAMPAVWPLAAAGVVVAMATAGWRYLIVKCTRYELTSHRLKTFEGVLNKVTHDLELYRVRDTELQQPLLLRLFGLGNVLLISSDATTPSIVVHAVSGSEALRESIRRHVEARRDQKRVRTAEID